MDVNLLQPMLPHAQVSLIAQYGPLLIIISMDPLTSLSLSKGTWISFMHLIIQTHHIT